MIASGLCVMGGCFAQDSAGAAVESYWHAHSVTLQVAIHFSTEMLMVPCVSEGYWLFGRLENVSNVNRTYTGQMIFWGSWSLAIYHVTFLGCKDGALGSFTESNSGQVELKLPGEEPVRWEEVSVSDNEFVLSSDLGQKYADLSTKNAFEPPVQTWHARMNVVYGNGEVAAYAMRAPAGGIRFAIQPMISPLGNSAFFDVDNAELIEQ